MFCSEVTFEFIYTGEISFEVNRIKGRGAAMYSKLTNCLMPFAAGSGEPGKEMVAMNVPQGRFQSRKSLPGTEFTVQRQHRHRDGRGNLMEGVY